MTRVCVLISSYVQCAAEKIAFVISCSTVQWSNKADWTRTRNPKVIWEEPRCHPLRHWITTPQSPQWLQWDAPHLPPKLPLLFDDLHPHLIHSQLTHQPKGHPDPISRFPQFTGRTDRQTDRWARRQTCTNTRLRSIDCIATRLKIQHNFVYGDTLLSCCLHYSHV